jgi:hypothetical protein
MMPVNIENYSAFLIPKGCDIRLYKRDFKKQAAEELFCLNVNEVESSLFSLFTCEAYWFLIQASKFTWAHSGFRLEQVAEMLGIFKS